MTLRDAFDRGVVSLRELKILALESAELADTPIWERRRRALENFETIHKGDGDSYASLLEEPRQITYDEWKSLWTGTSFDVFNRWKIYQQLFFMSSGFNTYDFMWDRRRRVFTRRH